MGHGLEAEKFHLETVVGISCHKCGHQATREINKVMELHKKLHIGCSQCGTILMRFWVTEDYICHDTPGRPVLPLVISSEDSIFTMV